MADQEERLSPERRSLLAQKARILYGKYCERRGSNCVENFVEYHLSKSEFEVAVDLLAYLEEMIHQLKEHDLLHRINDTQQLALQIRKRLEIARIASEN